MTPHTLDKSLSIVIPMYNEEEGVIPLLQRFHELLKTPFFRSLSIELIFVDDGSTDITIGNFFKGLNLYPVPAKLYVHSKNGGQSKAIFTGCSFSSHDYIAIIDSDLQCDPQEIETLFKKISSYDCIIGKRAKRKDIFWKKILSKIANRIRRYCIHDGTFDSGSPLKLFHRRCLGVLPYFKGSHRFIPAYFSMAGYSVTEIDIPHYERKYGTSKYSFFSRGISIFFDFLATSWLFHRKIDTKIEVELATLQSIDSH